MTNLRDRWFEEHQYELAFYLMFGHLNAVLYCKHDKMRQERHYFTESMCFALCLLLLVGKQHSHFSDDYKRRKSFPEFPKLYNYQQ